MIIGKCPVCGGDMIVGSDMTNADRIRSMTDEELAEFFTTTEVKCYKRLGYTSDVERFKDQWLEWLKEEVMANYE